MFDKWIAGRINANSKIDFQHLINHGFILISEDASSVLAECKQVAMLEREERRGEKEEKEVPFNFQWLLKFELNDLQKAYFKKETPSVDILQLREEMISYCKSTGKKYKDYYITLQTWARRRQQESKTEVKSSSYDPSGGTGI